MDSIQYYILFRHLGLNKNKNTFINKPSETSEKMCLHFLMSDPYFDKDFYLTDANPKDVESISGFSAKVTGTLS